MRPIANSTGRTRVAESSVRTSTAARYRTCYRTCRVRWISPSQGVMRIGRKAATFGCVNLSGTKRIRNISTGADAAMSLAISGGKVYWTERTGHECWHDQSGEPRWVSCDTTRLNPKAVPMGIAVDGSRSKIFWTNSRGRVQSANLDGSKIQNVVDGLGMPGDMVLSNSVAAPTAAKPTTPTQTTQTTDTSKYDVNG